jgi:hypothetical protein
VAGTWTVMLAAGIGAAFNGPEPIAADAVLPAAVGIAAYPLFAFRLARISRSAKPGGWADALDATMTALAAYLLI